MKKGFLRHEPLQGGHAIAALLAAGEVARKHRPVSRISLSSVQGLEPHGRPKPRCYNRPSIAHRFTLDSEGLLP
jgi:hypothetical protein